MLIVQNAVFAVLQWSGPAFFFRKAIVQLWATQVFSEKDWLSLEDSGVPAKCLCLRVSIPSRHHASI